jgi:predicted  nucleic acid-binding Zn-ribbon protein
MENTNEFQESKKNNNKIYLLLVVVLALFTTNAILYIRNKKADERVVQLSDDKTRMQTEIDKIEADLDKANTNYAALSGSMKKEQGSAREKISQLREALRKGELTQKQLILAQEDVKQLRYFVTKYVADIEVLRQQNDSLKTSVAVANEQVKALEGQNKDLNKKVSAATALKAFGVSVTAVRIKSSGKESSVSKADHAQKLNISFNLVDNDFAQKALHTIFLRVVDPSGNVVGATGNSTLASGETINFSYKTAIEFANDGRMYTLGWNNQVAFVKGEYTITMYADGYVLGAGKITLK